MKKLILLIPIILLVSCSTVPEDSGPKEPPNTYSLYELDEQPKATHQEEAAYPAEESGQGRAIVQFYVSTDGEPFNVSIIETVSPAFGKSAEDAIKKWRFTPGSRDGYHVNVRNMTHIFYFTPNK